MLTNERRRQILNNVKSSGYPGGVSEAFRAAEQGIDVVAQFQEQQAQEQEIQVANTQQEQEVGLREQHAMGNTDASMAFPNVKPNQSFNTVGMKAPIDIQKVDGQGHLVESYKNVPPGIQDLPTGPAEGTVIESPAAYQKGGVKKEDLEIVKTPAEYAVDRTLNPPEHDIFFTDESARGTVNKARRFINQKASRLGQYYEAYIRDNPYAKAALEEEKRSSGPSFGFLKKAPLVAAMLSPLEAGRGSTVVDPKTGVNKYTGEKEYTPFQKGGVKKKDVKAYSKAWDTNKRDTKHIIQEMINQGANLETDTIISSIGYSPLGNQKTDEVQGNLADNINNANITDSYFDVMGNQTQYSEYPSYIPYGSGFVALPKTHQTGGAKSFHLKGKDPLGRSFAEGGVRKYHEGGTAEQDHMNMMNQGTLDAHNAEGNTGGNTDTDTGMYGNPDVNPDGTPKIDFGLSIGTEGIKPIIGGGGMKKIADWGKGVWDKSSGWGKAGLIASGVAAPIAAVGTGLVDPSKWFQKEGGLRKYKKGGKRNCGYIQKYLSGGVRKYQTAGFNFNPADFDPNYDQGSVSDNTNISNFQEDQSNYAAKEAQLTKIAEDAKWAEQERLIKLGKGTVVNLTHKNAGIALSNSLLGNQLAGGYGGSNMRKSIETNPEKIEEIYKNTMRSSGMNTMRDVALGVASFGAGAQINNTGTSNFVQRALSYPAEVTSKAIGQAITAPTIRKSITPLLKAGYNAGYITGLPNVIGGTLGAGVDYMTGKSTATDAGLEVAKNALNFIPAWRGFSNLGPLAKNYSSIKHTGKALLDVYKGNYTNAALRFASINKNLGPGAKYTLKHLKRWMPKTDEVQNLPVNLFTPSGNKAITRNYLGEGISTKSLLKYGGYKPKHII